MPARFLMFLRAASLDDVSRHAARVAAIYIYIDSEMMIIDAAAADDAADTPPFFARLIF